MYSLNNALGFYVRNPDHFFDPFRARSQIFLWVYPFSGQRTGILNEFHKFEGTPNKRQCGTNKFIGLTIKETVPDYQKRVPVNYAGVHELIQTYDY
jgi:hypothetical protein